MNKPEDEREVTGITVHYSNDTTKEIMHGC